MAVDTAAKRLSMLDMGPAAATPGLPAPDGAFTQPDRQHLLWLYSGIAASGAAPVVAVRDKPVWPYTLKLQALSGRKSWLNS